MQRAEVETIAGRVAGEQNAGVYSFRGVPFAAPPAGPARFQPPSAPLPWTGVRDATQAGPGAPQFSLPFFGWINAATGPLDEDCLSLNLWTPGLDASKRPVLVWIHGGGFMVGSGATPIYSGDDLAMRGDAVIVTINYRLGALGYAHLGLLLGDGFERSTNLGVRDQIAALEWVRDNIAAFGGDPNNVTLFGQSAGAMSIGALLASPRACELFHKAICQSGAGHNVLDAEVAQTVASKFLRELGGPPPSPEALGRIPVDRILAAQQLTMNDLVSLQNMMLWQPVVDGDVIPEQPIEAVRNGGAAHIPILTGATLDEWKLMRPIDGGLSMTEDDLLQRFSEALPAFPAAPDARSAVAEFREAVDFRCGRTTPTEVWTAFQSGRVFHYPSSRLGEAQSAAGGSAYAYLFTWRPALARMTLGAFHSLDIPFVFGSIRHPLALAVTGFTASAAHLSRTMQRAWLNFAREGSPADSYLPEWREYEAIDRGTMTLGRSCEFEEAPLDDERSLFEAWSGDSPIECDSLPRRRAAGR